jgi:hypothetical protein
VDPATWKGSPESNVRMKYWGFLAGKVLVAAVLLYAVWIGIYRLYPIPQHYVVNRQAMFLHDLPWTTLIFVYQLLVQGVLFMIVQDQRLRCRTCGRRLRMPVTSGSHAHVLFGPPRTDYICIYGHGTLQVPEVNVSGRERPGWKQNDDMWKELYASMPAKSKEDPDD